MATPRFALVLALLAAVLSSIAPLTAQSPSPATNRPAVSRSQPTNDAIARIRDEGLNHSQVMEMLSYLSDVIGGRLTGSPNFKRSAEWTREKLESFGLTQARVEAWGPFGRGWSLKRFSAQIVEPQAIPLIAQPKAWSPGLEQPLTAELVLIDARTETELQAYQGKLRGRIAMVSSPRELKPWFEAPAQRLTDGELLRLANASDGRPSARSRPADNAASPAPGGRRFGANATNAVPRADSAGAPRGTNPPAGRTISSMERLSFAAREGAALIVSGSSGDGGTLFVADATVPSGARGTNAPRRSAPSWATNAAVIPPQIMLASEDYNRLVRMMRLGEKPRMAVEFQAQFHDDDLMSGNVVAEIPGGDLKDEIVMLGGHLDSWHSGTGATDNGAGVAVALEAVRILQALKLQPRRTIRVGLWGGEEQGLLGSKAYVTKHFGYYTNLTNITAARAPKDDRAEARTAASTNTNSNANARATRKLVRQREYDNFCAYFNLDNGTGKIRGVYLQGNEAARPLFRRWLAPFRDLGAETLTFSDTGGTDHISFDTVGLPAFQFIQDPIDYFSRTHHSNMDVYDRVQAEDMKQASVIMAAFVYNAAMLDGAFPRKKTTEPAR